MKTVNRMLMRAQPLFEEACWGRSSMYSGAPAAEVAVKHLGKEPVVSPDLKKYLP